ncbi:importin subunit alpha-1-like [Daphnia pulicaria]|uniref:importin subunit alpha-1-like n=1 Tax=Daphnia pulicaria TaxID=35523 RepID=UPI001EEA10D4|nr:importin subunit alpha-1-like [Daphnia pulicaria]
MQIEVNPSLFNYSKQKCRIVLVSDEGLRKVKEDYFLLKPQLGVDYELLYPLQEPNHMAADKMSIEDIVNGINSGDINKEITAAHAARNILTREYYPPIDILINANVVPKLVEFLSRVNNPDLQLDSASAIANILSGTSDQTKAVVSAGAVPGLISLLASPHPVVAEIAIRALGNIAIDGPEHRDVVIEQGILEPLLLLIKPETSVEFLSNVTSVLLNLCCHVNNPLNVPTFRQLLPVLAHLIKNNDEEILADACWVLAYISKNSDERTQEVCDAGVVPRLVTLLNHNETPVIEGALCSIGLIVAGSNTRTELVLAAGAWPLLAKLLVHSQIRIVHHAAKIASNIAAGNAVIPVNNVTRPLVDVPIEVGLKCQKEPARDITSNTLDGNANVIDLKISAIGSLCTLLKDKEPETIEVVLDSLALILEAAVKMDELEKVSLHAKKCGGFDCFRAFQSSPNIKIRQKSLAILERYFSTHLSNEDESAPSTSGVWTITPCN